MGVVVEVDLGVRGLFLFRAVWLNIVVRVLLLLDVLRCLIRGIVSATTTYHYNSDV